MNNRFERPDTQEQREYMAAQEAMIAAPQRLEREYVSWIKAGMSDGQAEELFGRESQGEFDGIDRRITVPIDLREEFYDNLLSNVFLSLYNDITASIGTGDRREIRKRLARSAQNTIELIVNIAGSSARERGQFSFEMDSNDRARNILTYNDMVKVQIALDQFGYMAAFPEENPIMQVAAEIASGRELTDTTLAQIDQFRIDQVNIIDMYSESLQKAQNEAIAVPIDVRSDARAFGALLMMMNQTQLGQLIDHEVNQVKDGAQSLDEGLFQIQMLAIHTDIAPGVVFRKLNELALAMQNPADAQEIRDSIDYIETQKASISAQIESIANDFISNLEVGDVQTFGKRGTFANLLTMLWGMTTATLSGLQMVTNPGSAVNHTFYLASGVAVANFAYNRMQGGRGTEGFERLARGITMGSEDIENYGRDAVTAEVASLTAQEVGFRITRDFYSEPSVINLLRDQTGQGYDQFTIEQFEIALRNSENVPDSAKEAFREYRTRTNDDYLFTALNFTAHSYKMLGIETREQYVEQIGSRVGLELSDFNNLNV